MYISSSVQATMVDMGDGRVTNILSSQSSKQSLAMRHLTRLKCTGKRNVWPLEMGDEDHELLYITFLKNIITRYFSVSLILICVLVYVLVRISCILVCCPFVSLLLPHCPIYVVNALCYHMACLCSAKKKKSFCVLFPKHKT